MSVDKKDYIPEVPEHFEKPGEQSKEHVVLNRADRRAMAKVARRREAKS